MRFLFLFKTALDALRKNAVRSLLTITGIVIGITAIILVMSVGNGAESLIVGELGSLGAETLVIRPGKEPKGLTDFAEVLFADSLKERELKAIERKSNVPNLVRISPEVFVTGSATYRGESYKPVILGFTANFMETVFDLRLKEGSSFDNSDIRNKTRVAVIGEKVKEELFGNEDAVGKNITIKNQKFRVIGVYEKRGQVVFFDVDELVLVPYTTALTYLSGVKHYTQMVAQADNADNVEKTKRDIEATLREIHDIRDPADDDFHVQTQQGIVDQVSTIIGVFTMFLSFVVAIALVVGGVGVMNIMLVSVTERTREIGLRKAIGATNKDILTQFVIESVILTVAGGVIGIILGSVLAFIIAIILNQFFGLGWIYSFPIFGALLGFFVSTIIGLVFGIYPARKASEKSPVEALRYE